MGLLSSPAATARVVIVDDDDSVREVTEMVLAGAGHSVRATASGVARRPPPRVARNARRSSTEITDPSAGPFERAILRPHPGDPARTSAEASGAAVSSAVAIMKLGGLPGAAEFAGPR